MVGRLEDFARDFDVQDVAPLHWSVFCRLYTPNAKGLAKWPGFPAAATTAKERAACGTGFSQIDSRQSGLGEAVELASCCAWGDKALLLDSTEGMSARGLRILTPADCTGFSPNQYAFRDVWNRHLNEADWVPPICPPDRQISWICGEDCASGESVWLPADAVLIGRSERLDPKAVAVADSNGCAAGRTRHHAQVNAVLELVERDATGLWWYGLEKAHLLEAGDDPRVAKVASIVSANDRKLSLLDISSDLGIPVAAAASHDIDGGFLALGFGAGISMHSAVQKAVTELIQSELLVLGARSVEDPGPNLSHWIAEVTADHMPVSSGVEARRVQDAKNTTLRHSEALDFILDKCMSGGIRITFLDQTRREFQIPVWRAVSPDLCHYKPRLGRVRLLQEDATQITYPEDLSMSAILRI